MGIETKAVTMPPLPNDQKEDENDKHQMLRRGIPYGSSLHKFKLFANIFYVAHEE